MELPLDLSLVTAGDRLLAGVSGGPDSLALLHALSGRRTELGIEVVAAHVHHGMRAEAAEADVRFLEETCAAWGVPLAVERVDVPGLASERRVSIEEAGRAARYEAFDRLARGWGCARVATAHTADDQAETVLLNLFRGAGIDGLAGIPPTRPLSRAADAPVLVRPLLRTWRRSVEAYCRAHALQPREDSTNRDLRYRRSRIRHELLPQLGEYAPHLKEGLARLAEQAREEQALLQPEAERLLRSAILPPAPRPALPFRPPALLPELMLDGAVLSRAPAALARRALRLGLRGAAGDAVEMNAGLIERLLDLARGVGPPAWDLPGSPLRVVRRDGSLLLLQVRAREPAPRTRAVLLPGRVEAPEFGLCLEGMVTTAPSDLRLPPGEAILNLEALCPPLRVRVPEAGDRFRPLGAPGSRLLSDLFTDRKIPRELRPAWPLLEDREGLLWVVGLAVAERVRVAPGAARCLRLRASPC